MTEDQVRMIAAQALQMTSANHLRVSLAFKKGDQWNILLSLGDREWVVKVAETADSEQLRHQIAFEVQRLF